MKNGDTVGIMSSFNRIGTIWTGGSYALLTEVLRNEWGFTGTVITDYSTDAYCDPYQMIYAGGDLALTSTIFLDSYDASNATDVTMIRRAAKDIFLSDGALYPLAVSLLWRSV